MKEYILNADALQTWDEAYNHLTRVFNFPLYFGRNLDALDEVLHDLVYDHQRITVTLIKSGATNTEVYNAIMRVFRENEDIIIKER